MIDQRKKRGGGGKLARGFRNSVTRIHVTLLPTNDSAIKNATDSSSSCWYHYDSDLWHPPSVHRHRTSIEWYKMPRFDSVCSQLSPLSISGISTLHVSTLSSSVAFVSILPWGSSLVLGNRSTRPPLLSFCYLLFLPRHQLIAAVIDFRTALHKLPPTSLDVSKHLRCQEYSVARVRRS
jgi:hypothetical protein